MISTILFPAIFCLLVWASKLAFAEVIKDSSDIQIYGKDKDTSRDMTNAVVIGVGTAMGAKEYSDLAEKIVNMAERTLVIILDPNGGGLSKLDPKKFGKKFDEIRVIVSKLGYTVKSWFAGGHSGSGQSATDALMMGLLGKDIKGFIGLDPFKYEKGKGREINIPVLIWAFQEYDFLRNFGVALAEGGAGFYNAAASTKNSYLYKFDKNFGHCVFSNNGCMNVCPIGGYKKGDPLLAYAHEVVAQSISAFVKDGSSIKESKGFLVTSKVSAKARELVDA